MFQVRSLILILIFVPTLFAVNLPTKSNWLVSNEYAQKDNVFFYDSIINSNNKKNKLSIYLKEFGYALGGSTCCLGSGIGVGILLASGIQPANENNWIDAFGAAYAQGFTFVIVTGVSIILTPAITATSVCKVAKEIDPGGSYGITCLGAYCGLIVGGGFGIGSGYIIDQAFHNQKLYFSAIPLAFLGNSLGAVIGYNLSVSKKSRSGYGLLRRLFDLPSFTMKTEKTQEGKTISTFDFRLINTRF